MIPELDYRYLKPAELCVADRPMLVSTVLGSCVSLVLHAPRKKVSAICHALLPSGDCHSSTYRFVDCSIRHMVEEMSCRGVKPHQMQAKLFGGADMFSFQSTLGGRGTVGSQNILMARELIEEHGLDLVACDVGGARGRKLMLYSHTGEVFVKLLGTRQAVLAAGEGAGEAQAPPLKPRRPARHGIRGEI